MNEFDESMQLQSPQQPEQEVDLLVDGELSESDRRSLLMRLEREPDGWRRCALAFLEAQCWKTELGEMAAKSRGVAAAESTVSRPAAEVRQQGWRQYMATSLAMAASFLIALVAGMGLRGNWSVLSPHPGASVQEAILTSSPETRQAATAGQWTTVTLDPAKSGNGQGLRGLSLPALQCNSLNEEMLTGLPSVISPELQRAFEQSGHQIDQQREIVPVQMKDGRRLVVPVDHIQIHYVGRPSL